MTAWAVLIVIGAAGCLGFGFFILCWPSVAEPVLSNIVAWLGLGRPSRASVQARGTMFLVLGIGLLVAGIFID